MVILKRRDYDAYLKKFCVKKKRLRQIYFYQKFRNIFLCRISRRFQWYQTLKEIFNCLGASAFFRTSKKTTNRIYFDLCFKFINPFQSNSNEELHDGYNCINHLKGSSLIMSLVDFFRIFKKSTNDTTSDDLFKWLVPLEPPQNST